MAYYKSLRNETRYPRGKDKPGQAGWISERLLRLRAMLNGKITAIRQPNSLIIGSWNIRHFDGGRLRLDESMHYIAEIIDHFDICAIQEVKTIEAMERLMRLLGPNWDYFVNDSSGGGRGNHERMAFAYNKNKVFFRNLIGELVLEKDTFAGNEQIGRTPFFAAFQSGWFRFVLCSTHIVFTEQEGRPMREDEIRAVATVLRQRARESDEVHIMLGDMNIDSPQDASMKALTDNGFLVTPLPASSLDGKKAYDQIAFTGPADVKHMLNAGIIPWHDVIYSREEAAAYVAMAAQEPKPEDGGKVYPKTDRAFSSWRTHEISDHLPVWIEIQTDYSNAYLQDIVQMTPK